MTHPVVDLVMPKREVLLTLRAPEQCRQRIGDLIDSDFALLGGKPFVGSTFAGGARLRKRIRYRNSFQTVARLDFQAHMRGTEVVIHSRMPIFTMVFLAFWFGLLFVGASAVTLNMASNGDWLVGLFPALMAGFGALLVLGGRWMARNEHDEIVTFVRDALEVRPADTHRRTGSPIVS